MNEKNMTLLSQKEIDTLIGFLTRAKVDITSSDVLNQTSIDKLISLIRGNADVLHKFQINIPVAESMDEQLIRFFSDVDGEFDKTSSYELVFQVNETNGQIELNASNTTTGTLVPITPGKMLHLEDSDSSTWGSCLLPLIFDQVASRFFLKYRRETLDAVCVRCAKIMYGNEEAAIPSFYLPSEQSVFTNLLI